MIPPSQEITDAQLVAALVKLNSNQLLILIAFVVVTGQAPRKALLQRLLDAIGANT